MIRDELAHNNGRHRLGEAANQPNDFAKKLPSATRSAAYLYVLVPQVTVCVRLSRQR